MLTAPPAGPVLDEPRLLSHLPGPGLGALYLRLQRRAPLDGFLELRHLHRHFLGRLQAALQTPGQMDPAPGPARS